jgi:4-amino-4-deoxy-L-arabinose transferase-like glycosyltransferase
MVDHVLRVLSGQKLYVQPSLEFVPFIYPPLFVYLSAMVSMVTGVGFEPLRLVSFVSSLAVFLSS